jgi:hypothetical protein
MRWRRGRTQKYETLAPDKSSPGVSEREGTFGWQYARSGSQKYLMNIRQEGDKLIVEIDISAEARANAPISSTGKSRVVESTHGFQAFGPAKLNVTAICGLTARQLAGVTATLAQRPLHHDTGRHSARS